MISTSCNHCRFSFYEWKWKLLFKNNAIWNRISLNRNVSKSYIICWICSLLSVSSGKWNIFLLHIAKNTYILIYKAKFFYYDCTKVISFLSNCLSNDLWMRMHKAPLLSLLYYFIFIYQFYLEDHHGNIGKIRWLC